MNRIFGVAVSIAVIALCAIGGYVLSDAGTTEYRYSPPGQYESSQSRTLPESSGPRNKTSLPAKEVTEKGNGRPAIIRQPKVATPDPQATSVQPPSPTPQASNASPARTTTILFLHGGCWIGGEPKNIEHMAVLYRTLGYNAEAVPYRDGNDNILHQIENIKARVVQHQLRGPVVLYGISAGGTLAAALAAEGIGDGSVVVGSPTNLTNAYPPVSPWIQKLCLGKIGMTAEELQSASPIFRIKNGVAPSPQYLQYAKSDELISPLQGSQYHQAALAKQPDTAYTEMAVVGHKNIANSRRYAGMALSWIAQRWPPSSK